MNFYPLNSSNSDELSFQDNIQELFEKLYKRTASKIISSLIKKGANKTDAEDSYHEAIKVMLLKFYSQNMTIGIDDAEKYVRTVAKNNLIAKLKFQGKFIKIDDDTELTQNPFLAETTLIRVS